MEWWFTADLHFDHTNIMKHCKRPFGSVEEMNETLIRNWNACVRPGDTVVVAGDLTLHTDPELVRYRFIRYLHGNIIWVKGNHDYWMKGGTFRHIYHKQIKGGPFVAVSHYPLRSWNRSHHGSWNLHGHTHGTILPCQNQYDVGVDNNNYFPVSLSQLGGIIGKNNDAGAPEADYLHGDLTREEKE